LEFQVEVGGGFVSLSEVVPKSLCIDFFINWGELFPDVVLEVFEELVCPEDIISVLVMSMVPVVLLCPVSSFSVGHESEDKSNLSLIVDEGRGIHSKVVDNGHPPIFEFRIFSIKVLGFLSNFLFIRRGGNSLDSRGMVSSMSWSVGVVRGGGSCGGGSA